MLTQLIINGIVSGSVYLLIARGFALIYQTTRFFHFAHAIVFTFGAYFTFLFNNIFGISLFYAIPIGIAFSCLVGCMMDIFIYRKLRRKNASSIIHLIASLGIYIVLQNTISMAFGDDTKSIRYRIIQEGLNFFDARITEIQIITILASIFLLILTSIFLNKTKAGIALRAVANDAELSDISGIESDKIILWAFFIGSALSGIAGTLFALDVDMTPTMGMNVLLMGVVAVIIGGVGSIPGIALGAFLLGLAQHLGVWKISSQWQNSISFIILLIFLLFRPQGFLGKKIKKATV